MLKPATFPTNRTGFNFVTTSKPNRSWAYLQSEKTNSKFITHLAMSLKLSREFCDLSMVEAHFNKVRKFGIEQQWETGYRRGLRLHYLPKIQNRRPLDIQRFVLLLSRTAPAPHQIRICGSESPSTIYKGREWRRSHYGQLIRRHL